MKIIRCGGPLDFGVLAREFSLDLRIALDSHEIAVRAHRTIREILAHDIVLFPNEGAAHKFLSLPFFLNMQTLTTVACSENGSLSTKLQYAP